MSQAALSASTSRASSAGSAPAPAEPVSRIEAAGPVAIAEPQTPPIFDTYSLVYAFSWAFLIPGLALLNTQPFRTYDFAYVTYVTLPFVLGMLATFLTDGSERGAVLSTRIAILTPLSLVTGVGVLWTLALTAVPISPYLEPQNYRYTTPIVAALLVAIVAPLVWSIWRRVTRRLTWQAGLQIAVMIVAIAGVAWVGYMMFQPHNALRGFARKDITIYVTGALMWYLPSFGIAAGVWRKLGIV
ncbi:MAG TPA: hypothetical protein VIL41_08305 [Coriobacteriia bacterium]